MEKRTMITRKEYMDNSTELHHAYYMQFDCPAIRRMVNDLMPLVRESKDEHLNDVPMKRWDAIAIMCKREIAQTNKALGNGSVWSYSNGVCAAKAIARDILSKETQTN